MDRVKGEICYSGLWTKGINKKSKKYGKEADLLVGLCRHLWYDGYR